MGAAAILRLTKHNNTVKDTDSYPHSTVILREYLSNIPLKSCNISRTFIKLIERFLKYCRNLAMSVENIINVMLLQY